MSKAESDYMGRVAALGCVVCRRMGYGPSPALVHHIRTGIGMGRRASNFDTIPLCKEHHQGMTGIHGMGRKAWERHIGITEIQLLEQIKGELNGHGC